ncbi:MAG: ABC transporter substrate-binding protein [Myxococcota bacterium]
MRAAHRIFGVVLLAGVFGLGSARAETAGARELIQQTVDEVIAVLQNAELDDAQRRERIEAIAYDRFHFETMSRLVLARRWRRFSEPQREAFMVEFRELLSRSYGRRINRYEQEAVEIGGERAEARGDVTVFTRIIGGSADGVEINYRLRQKGESWGIIDVVVEGVSLVSNYRSQFAELLGNASPDDLLRKLREKNSAGEEVVDTAVANEAS